MALSNAERQKKFRQQRKEQVNELDSLRNEFQQYKNRTEASLLLNEKAQQHAQDLFWEMEKLRNENDLLRKENQELRSLRKKSRKLMDYLTEEAASFYVDSGVLKLLQWPETIGTIKAKGFDPIPYLKIDKKYRSQCDKLISVFNLDVKLNNELLENAP